MMKFFKEHKGILTKIISVSVVVALTITMAVSVFAQELSEEGDIQPLATAESTQLPEPSVPAPEEPTETPAEPTAGPGEPEEPTAGPTEMPSPGPAPEASPDAAAEEPQEQEEVRPTQDPATPEEPAADAQEAGAHEKQKKETAALEPGTKEAEQTPVYSSPAIFLGDIAALGSNDTIRLTDEQVAEIDKNLPEGLDPYRREVVLKAYSLVGKVKYFWGGKSTQTGWDIRWGNEAIVGSAGSSQTGTTREYGLDCSGYVLWCFLNAQESILMQQEPAGAMDKSGFVNGFGYGTSGQWEHSSQIPWEEAMPGDVLFYKNPQDAGINHIGIVVGTDEEGDMLVAHCSSSKNNVIISKAETSGFRYARRMDCMEGSGTARPAASEAVLPNGFPMFLTDEQAYEGAILNGWSID